MARRADPRGDARQRRRRARRAALRLLRGEVRRQLAAGATAAELLEALRLLLVAQVMTE